MGGWPSLEGRVGSLVRTLYRILALITAIYVVTDLPLEAVDLFRNSPAVSHYGFAVQRTARGKLPVTALYPSAKLAGLRADDTVIGLGDKRLPPGATRFNLGAELDALHSAPAKLVVADATGSVRTVALKPQAQSLGLIHIIYGMPIWAFGIVQLTALALPLLILLGASFLLYKKRPRDGEAMLLALSFLALVFSTSYSSWPFIYAHVPDVVADFAVQVGTALLWIAVAGVPDGRFHSIWARLALFAAAVYGLAGTWILSKLVHGVDVGDVQDWLEYAAIFLAVIANVARYRASAQIERQQIKWVSIGTVVALLAVVTTIALEHWGIQDAMVPWLRQITRNYLFVIIHISIPIGLAISILAYRLFDSDALVTRSAAYGALSVSMIGVFAASESIVQAVGVNVATTELGAFSGALATAFTAMMIAPMHSRIKHGIERVFRKDLFSMRESLPLLVADLRETSRLEAIANIVIERVWSGVRPTAAAILVGESLIAKRGIDGAVVAAWQAQWAPPSSTGIQCDKADRTLPVRVSLTADGIGWIGWLLLGPRPDGSLFDRDECRALKEIADPVARALAIAATREERSARHEDNIQTIRTRLDELETALARLAQAGKTNETNQPQNEPSFSR
jgi:hypothetical protein